MGFIADAMRIIENKRAKKENRQRGEDYLRQLEIDELLRRKERDGTATVTSQDRGSA